MTRVSEKQSNKAKLSESTEPKRLGYNLMNLVDGPTSSHLSQEGCISAQGFPSVYSGEHSFYMTSECLNFLKLFIASIEYIV